MVRPHHFFSRPPLKVCHPERSEGSAFLRSFAASSSAFSVNSVLRKTRAFNTTAPSTTLADIPADFQSLRVASPLPSTSIATLRSPLATIPFRITSFADPHPLTLTESYSYKKQGRGWGPRHLAPTQGLSTCATCSNTCNPNLFIDLLHHSLDIRGWGIRPSLRGSAHFPPLRYPFPCFASPLRLNLGALDEP